MWRSGPRNILSAVFHMEEKDCIRKCCRTFFLEREPFGDVLKWKRVPQQKTRQHMVWKPPTTYQFICLSFCLLFFFDLSIYTPTIKIILGT